MIRSVYLLLLSAFASSTIKRVPTLSDPLALDYQDYLSWKLEELQVEDYVKGSVWPKPQGETPNGEVYSLSPQNFKFTITGQSSDVLQDAISRYKKLTFPDSDDGDSSRESSCERKKAEAQGSSEITQLTVKVINKYENLTLESDESCKYRQSLLLFC